MSFVEFAMGGSAMRCSLGEYGQPLCNVVDHPDRSHESFCATCGHRFVKREANLGLVGVFALIVSLLFLLLTARNGPTFDEANMDGANDIPPSNAASVEVIPSSTVSAASAASAASVASRASMEIIPSCSFPPLPEWSSNPDAAEDERIIDLPIAEQIDYLNGGDRIALVSPDNES